MHSVLQKTRNFVENRKIELATAVTATVITAQNGLSAFATGGVKVPKITVSDDGTVDLGSNSSGTDIKSGFNTLIGNSQFVLGAIVTIASLIILGFGLWKAQKAAKELQDNSPMGWSSASAILKGTIVGALLMATLGFVLAASAATGQNMFK